MILPLLVALLGILAAVGVWMSRARNAAHAARELTDLAGDVMNAARRLGFRRNANVHPAESVDDPALAITALAMAFLELDGLPTREAQQQLAQSVADHTGSNGDKTEEMMIVGRWLVSECNGPEPAITRLARRLTKLDPAASQPLLAVLNDVGQVGGGLSPKQQEALQTIARNLRLG